MGGICVFNKIEKVSRFMAIITQKYLDKLSPQERTQRINNFKNIVTLRPTGNIGIKGAN